MSQLTLTPAQVLFILRASGKDVFISPHFPKENFNDIFINMVNNTFGQFLIHLALRYQIYYTDKGEIACLNSPTIEKLKIEVEAVGMRIPEEYRKSSEKALTYIQDFGSRYFQFRKIQQYDPKIWLNNLLMGNDPYVNPYLETFLRSYYTDFDFFHDPNFGSYLCKIVDSLRNRDQIISAVLKKYRPAGYFWFSFDSNKIILEHVYHNEYFTYDTVDSIKTIMDGGKIISSSFPLNSVGIYQCAFLLKPSYLEWIYQTSFSSQQIEMITDLYTFILRQIKIYEQGGTKYRFSEKLRDFNFDLDT